MVMSFSRRRGATTLFRRKIPHDLKTRIGATEIVRSLGRATPGEARRMASALWQATETLFMTIRANPAMTRQSIQTLTEKTLAPWVEQQDDMLTRIHDGSATDALETTGNQLAKMKGLQAVLQQQLARSPMPSPQDDPASLLHAMVKNSLLRQYAVMAQNVADALGASNGPTADGDVPVILREGEVSIPPGNPFTHEQVVNLLSTLKPGEPVEKLIPLKFLIGEAAQTPGAGDNGDNPTRPAPSYSWAGRLLSEIWTGFVDDVIADREWKPAMRGQSASTFKLFRSICRDRMIGDYSKADIAEFKRQLHRLPAAYDKAPWREILLARGKADPDFAGVIAAAAEADADKPLKERVPKLTAKTINRHLTVINKLWVRAEANGAVAANTGKIAQGMALKTRRTSDEGSLLRKKGDRDFWDLEELSVFFQLPFFLGCASSRSRLTPGIVIPMDALWWGCIIAPHHGMRREEIFQLKVKHVVRDEETGIWYFDLKTDEDLQLKEDDHPDQPSRRYVPLHDNLLKLGFVERRVQGRSREERLFPEIPVGNDAGSWGAAPGRTFSRLKIEAGFRSELDFHAFRHSVCTLLYRTEVFLPHAEELVGHASQARKSTFAAYNHGQTLRALKAAIDKLVIPIDIDRIHAAIAKSPPPAAFR